MRLIFGGVLLSLGPLVELACGSVRTIEFFLFVNDNEFEEEAIVGAWSNLRCDEVEDDERFKLSRFLMIWAKHALGNLKHTTMFN